MRRHVLTLIDVTKIVEVAAYIVVFCVFSLLDHDRVGLGTGAAISIGSAGLGVTAHLIRSAIRRTATYRTAYYGNRRISTRS